MAMKTSSGGGRRVGWLRAWCLVAAGWLDPAPAALTAEQAAFPHPAAAPASPAGVETVADAELADAGDGRDPGETEPAAAAGATSADGTGFSDPPRPAGRTDVVGTAPDAAGANDEAAGSGASRVRLRLDVTGEIFAPAGRDAPPIRRPIAVDARLDFVQTTSRAGPRAIRRYLDAAADLRVDGDATVLRLPPDARTVLVSLEGTTPVPYLAEGFLSRDELDLLETPFDPLLLDLLLPALAVARGDSWAVPADAVAGLLAIDTVESGGLEATCGDVADGRASVALKGMVDGAVDGVPTHVIVEGSFVAPAVETADGFRLGRGVSGVAVTLRERREASHVAPGFDVEARLAQAVGEPEGGSGAPPPDPAPAGRPGGAGRPGFVLQRDAARRFSLVHDARWRAIEDGPDGLVLRLLDRGALVAQCSVTALPRGTASSPPTVAEVERDLRRSLAGQVGRVEQAEESIRGDGVRLVRVVAAGTADGLPFRWIHHVLTGAAGHRLAVTCTLDERHVQRFADADRELVGGIVLPSESGDSQTPGGRAAAGADREARLPAESRTP